MKPKKSGMNLSAADARRGVIERSQGDAWLTLPSIIEINDKDSSILPSVAEMRDSQREGATQPGLDDNITGKLGEALGHEVEYKY